MELEAFKRAYIRSQTLAGASKSLEQLVAIELEALKAEREAQRELAQARARGFKQALDKIGETEALQQAKRSIERFSISLETAKLNRQLDDYLNPPPTRQLFREPYAERLSNAPAVGKETPEQRQQRRYEACIKAGLEINTENTYAHLPRGVGKLAKSEGISTVAFTKDVKLHIERMKRS